MIYLVVSAFSLALMLVVYRLTLSRTTFHGFNRGVLLCSLALAALVPFCAFQWFNPAAWMLKRSLMEARKAAR